MMMMMFIRAAILWAALLGKGTGSGGASLFRRHRSEEGVVGEAASRCREGVKSPPPPMKRLPQGLLPYLHHPLHFKFGLHRRRRAQLLERWGFTSRGRL